MERPNILTNRGAAENYINACHLLKQEALGNITTYDYFAYWHEQAMTLMTPANTALNPTSRNAAHGGPSFGPWHRLMLLVFEAQCRRVLGDSRLCSMSKQAKLSELIYSHAIVFSL